VGARKLVQHFMSLLVRAVSMFYGMFDYTNRMRHAVFTRAPVRQDAPDA
jgi:hypothetical protein